MRPLKVELTTKDSLKITGKYIPGSLPFGVVLLHMMPATKESFDSFAEKISGLGLHTLAIDLRGHGESEGGDYKNFTDEQHQQSEFDIEAAVGYLQQQNPNIKIGLIGASIGANLAIQHATKNDCVFVVALSAGLNYRGVNGFELVSKIPEYLPVYFVSARDDERSGGNNAVMAEQLYIACNSKNKVINISQTGGHGTDLLNSQPELQGILLSWIKEICNA